VLANKKYCLDTSGVSNPLESMPEDIIMYNGIWTLVKDRIQNGAFAVNTEIYDELCRLDGNVGDCIRDNKDALILEVGQTEWDWKSYLQIVEEMRTKHQKVISEYNHNRKGTVGLNDVSIVALAKSLALPMISMESISFQSSDLRIRILRLCSLEEVEHLNFNDMLKRENL
jgi:hypothetical protein